MKATAVFFGVVAAVVSAQIGPPGGRVPGGIDYNGICPSHLKPSDHGSSKCPSSTSQDEGSPCCQVKASTFECCYPGDATNHCPTTAQNPDGEESCIPGVGCRCPQTGVKLNRTHRVVALGTTNIPKTMKAVTVSARAKDEGDWSRVAVVTDHKVPSPGIGQVLIKVAASSVNPVDYKDLTSSVMAALTARGNKTVGFDVAGTIVSTGSLPYSRPRLKVGDEVWADLGTSTLTRHDEELGAWAEYAVAEESQVGLKPKSLSFGDAASMPLVGLTAYQAFRMAGAPWSGKKDLTIAITSGSGGTGTIALQLAKAYGATRIITSTGSNNFDLCKSLGATEVYDYHNTTIWENVANDTVDIVIDNYNSVGTADLAMPSLKSGGVFLFIPAGFGDKPNGEASKNPKDGVKQVKFVGTDSSNYADLDALKKLADTGFLQAVVKVKYELSDIFKALDATFAGHAVGKIGLIMPSRDEVIVV